MHASLSAACVQLVCLSPNCVMMSLALFMGVRSKIYDSPDMPEAEATFALTDKDGVTDAD